MIETTEPLARFEERLLAELKQEAASRQPTVHPAAPRPRRIRRV